MTDRTVIEIEKKNQGLSNKVKSDMKINSSALITVFSDREIQNGIIKYTWVAEELFFLK